MERDAAPPPPDHDVGREHGQGVSVRGVEGEGGGVLVRVLVIVDLRRAAHHLANLAETAERYPSLLFLGAPPAQTEVDK